MKRFEYHIEKSCTESRLNELGSVGWELVAVTTNTLHVFVFFFKKEIKSPSSNPGPS